MSGRQVDLDEDLVFARQLLDAGRAEPVPGARTAAAFSAFAAGMVALQRHELEAGLSASSGASAAGWAARWLAAKWVALGALLGSAATMVWLEHGLATSPARSTAAARPSAAASASPVVVAAVGPVQGAPGNALSARAEARNVDMERRPVKVPTERSRPASSASSLAAEVAALDGIRTALAIGAWRDAELQLSRYRREFAQGALRNEAEALAITLLAAQGRKQAAASAASAFLANHPRDPQAASVRALLE
jgi:hypothetical protein